MTNNKSSIEAVVIPVGGYGTRLRQLTGAIPKAFLPVGDKPLIVHAVEEALSTGAKKIIIPCRPEDEELFRRQFRDNEDRKDIIAQNGRDHLLEDAPESYADMVEIVSVFKKEGPASTIASLVKERGIGVFGVILPDDLMVSDVPVLKQMTECFERTGLTTVGSRKANLESELPKNITFVKTGSAGQTCAVQIKPKEGEPISDQATCGRYIFDENFADIVEIYEKMDRKGEVSMSIIVKHCAKNEGLGITQLHNATYYDCGDPVGYATAQAAHLPPCVLQSIKLAIPRLELSKSICLKLNANQLKEASKTESVLTRDNVLSTIKAYMDNNDGQTPQRLTDIIGHGPLANGTMTWVDLYDSFENGIPSIPTGTSMNGFMFEELGVEDLQNTSKPQISLQAAFNSVAWHILKEKEVPKADSTVIEHGHFQTNKELKYGAGNSEALDCEQIESFKIRGRTWKQLDELMQVGLVGSIPRGMLLETFSKKVEERISNDNFTVPTAYELEEWMEEQLEAVAA